MIQNSSRCCFAEGRVRVSIVLATAAPQQKEKAHGVGEKRGRQHIPPFLQLLSVCFFCLRTSGPYFAAYLIAPISCLNCSGT